MLTVEDGGVDQLYVAPDRLGEGIGRRLLDREKERQPAGLSSTRSGQRPRPPVLRAQRLRRASGSAMAARTRRGSRTFATSGARPDDGRRRRARAAAAGARAARGEARARRQRNARLAERAAPGVRRPGAGRTSHRDLPDRARLAARPRPRRDRRPTTWRTSGAAPAPPEHTLYPIDRRDARCRASAVPAGRTRSIREFEDLVAVVDVAAAEAGRTRRRRRAFLRRTDRPRRGARTDRIRRVVSYEGAPPVPWGRGYQDPDAATLRRIGDARRRGRSRRGARDVHAEIVGMPEADATAFRADPIWPRRAAAVGTTIPRSSVPSERVGVARGARRGPPAGPPDPRWRQRRARSAKDHAPWTRGCATGGSSRSPARGMPAHHTHPEALRGRDRGIPRRAGDGRLRLMLFDLLYWIVFGFIAGALSGAMVGGRTARGCLPNVVVGVLGAIVGGWIAREAQVRPGRRDPRRDRRRRARRRRGRVILQALSPKPAALTGRHAPGAVRHSRLPRRVPEAVIISTEGLAKRCGRVDALVDLTMEVAPGEVFGFLGPERRQQNDRREADPQARARASSRRGTVPRCAARRPPRPGDGSATCPSCSATSRGCGRTNCSLHGRLRGGGIDRSTGAWLDAPCWRRVGRSRPGRRRRGVASRGDAAAARARGRAPRRSRSRHPRRADVRARSRRPGGVARSSGGCASAAGPSSELAPTAQRRGRAGLRPRGDRGSRPGARGRLDELPARLGRADPGDRTRGLSRGFARSVGRLQDQDRLAIDGAEPDAVPAIVSRHRLRGRPGHAVDPGRRASRDLYVELTGAAPADGGPGRDGGGTASPGAS